MVTPVAKTGLHCGLTPVAGWGLQLSVTPVAKTGLHCGDNLANSAGALDDA